MNAEQVIQLATIGMKLATVLIEQRTGQKVEDLTEEELTKEIADLEIAASEDLIEQGRERVQD